MTKLNLVRPYPRAHEHFSWSAREIALITITWVLCMIALALALGLRFR